MKQCTYEDDNHNHNELYRHSNLSQSEKSITYLLKYDNVC